MTKYSFLITGASSGLGLQIATEALKGGHSVVATARDPTAAAQSHPEIESLGGSWAQLDVTRPDTKDRVAEIVKEKSVNVLVNNAGYGLLGSLEDISEEEFITQIDTNLFGTMRCIKGALPHLRSLGPDSGATIVNIGSIVNLAAFPACTAYSASKMGVEALTETLALEVGTAGIRVILIDLGIFRTSFLHSFKKPEAGMAEAYSGGAVDATVNFLADLAGKQPGDPVQAARRIVEIVDRTGDHPLTRDLADKGVGKYLRVPLGSDSFGSFSAKIDSLNEVKSSSVFEALAKSTDFAERA
ncbi:oxidoreductase clan [Rhypophila sp. PSN 637]